MLLCNIGGGLRWVRGVHNEDHGVVKAQGQARLEPPRNPGCVSTGLCACAGGCGKHMVRGDERPEGGGNGRRKGAPSCGEARTGSSFDAHFRHCWVTYHPRRCVFRIHQRSRISPLTHSQGFWGAPAQLGPQPSWPPGPHCTSQTQRRPPPVLTEAYVSYPWPSVAYSRALRIALPHPIHILCLCPTSEAMTRAATWYLYMASYNIPRGSTGGTPAAPRQARHNP